MLATPLFENFLPVGVYTTIWCPPNASIIQAYEKTFKLEPSDLVHAYLRPSEDLNNFVKSCKVN